ncbi:adenylate/guanylate cyclase domain-containing protein [Microseira wollei]|uniref:Adenylate cyclase n=1 Tax=Microseira wollei NIES-4236 TaxID=2530354 RepID=A0AAV3XFF7_9CYAN|nr:adenylate/guanylate cyclase domain-containing protein [Microseira wollei]GET41119.1 adenylate/guanylate cyclase [Microseira wollei NIES-4236]
MEEILMSQEQEPGLKGDILIVDDTPNNLRLLSAMLAQQGYQVRKAINGKIALKGAQMSPPDLILLDINMPEMNGYEVCQKLKSLPETSKIPIIFISALDEALDKVKAFEVGGVDYITKPFQVPEVLARIENQLAQTRLNEELKIKNKQLEQEIRDREKAEVEIRLLLAATQAISRAADFHSALKVTISLVCETIGWDFGEAWVPADDATVLEYAQGWYIGDINLEEFKQKSLKFTFAPHIGLPGRVWANKEPEWIEDVSFEQSQSFLRAQLAAKVGLKAGFAIPILANDQVLAVLVFFKKESIPEQPHLVQLVNAVATQLGSLIQRKQAEEALRLSEERYHSIVDNAVEGIFQSTPAGRFLSANAALARIYGYDSPEELVSSVGDIAKQVYIDPQRRQEFIAAIEQNNAVHDFESLVRRKDGSKIWVSENARAVRDSTGKLLYYEGTVSDITARKFAQEALREQQQKTEQLLLNIIPEPVAQRLKQDPSAIADHFEDVTVLFADLVGFTEFSASTSPGELVHILNVVFSEFDRLAQRHGLEKIKTIGDAYMAVAGLPFPHPDHACLAAEMSLDMLAGIEEFNQRTGKSFNVRIGMNTGPVVAGVIGIKKFSYDLWGDTVNIASRMETNGVPGAIQVSPATYELLQDRYQFVERGCISIKGKGDMTTYLLTGRK